MAGPEAWIDCLPTKSTKKYSKVYIGCKVKKLGSLKVGFHLISVSPSSA
jgi:hypothetical protein